MTTWQNWWRWSIISLAVVSLFGAAAARPALIRFDQGFDEFTKRPGIQIFAGDYEPPGLFVEGRGGVAGRLEQTPD